MIHGLKIENLSRMLVFSCIAVFCLSLKGLCGEDSCTRSYVSFMKIPESDQNLSLLILVLSDSVFFICSN